MPKIKRILVDADACPNIIKEKLSLRNFMGDIRSTGQITGGPAPLTKNQRL